MRPTTTNNTISTPAPTAASSGRAVAPGAGGGPLPQTMLKAALAYAKQGIPVFPCRERGDAKHKVKAPYVDGGFKAATTDANMIRQWWRQWPNAMIGMPTGKASGRVVLDVDVKNGVDGFNTLAELEDAAREPGDPLVQFHQMVKTPNRSSWGQHGVHIHYAAVDGFGCTTGKLGPGLDTRGDGGYAILPPSTIDGVGPYEWTDKESPLQPPPAWMLKTLEAKPALPTRTDEATTATPTRPHHDVDEVKEALATISPDLVYDPWLKVGMALHSYDATEAGLAMWDEWSRKGKTYVEGEPARKWRDFDGKKGITINTLFAMAREAGWLATVAAWYDAGKKEYLVQNKRNAYLSLTEGQFKQNLRSQGISTKPGKGELLSPAEHELLRIRGSMDVSYAGPLAGWRAGFHEHGGERFLVTESPRLIAPAPGEWPVLQQLLMGLFTEGGDEPDQLRYLLSWWRLTLEALHAGERRHAQAVAVAGPRDCGKSLWQLLVTASLGGRMAHPYQFMTGLTAFNGDWFGAEHLAIDDEIASTDIRARRAVGQHLKQITVGTEQRCHRKGRDAITLSPFWRLTITLNDEPENLMVLPPLDDSMLDKVMLFRGYARPMPMPTGEVKDRIAFWNTLVAELPAFHHFLLHEWRIPEELRCERFGVKAWHHPAILNELSLASPEARLLNLIDASGILPSGKPWTGTAEQLEQELLTRENGVQIQVRGVLTWQHSCGTYLGRIARHHPDRVEKDRTGDARRWIIRRPQ